MRDGHARVSATRPGQCQIYIYIYIYIYQCNKYIYLFLIHLGLERDVRYLFRKLSAARRNPQVCLRCDRVELNPMRWSSRWRLRTSWLNWNHHTLSCNSPWSVSTFRRYAAGDSRLKVSEFESLAISSFIEILRFFVFKDETRYIDWMEI